jgi:hypothetical protein
VVIADISVSREHLRLEKRRRRWALIDVASGNGTSVNGRAVQRRLLRHGDEIAIGDTVLRFLEPGGVIVWRSGGRGRFARPGVRWGRPAIHAALVAAMLLIVLAALVRRQRVAAEVRSQQHRAAMHALARQKLEEGNALLKEGRVGEGRARLLLASELDGDDAEIARALESPAMEGPPAPAVSQPPSSVMSAAHGPAAATPPAAAAKPAAAVVRASRPTQRTIAAASPAPEQIDLAGRRALAERHLIAAREFSREDDLPSAASHLRAALENDPANAAAREELAGVAERVREVYLRAYVAKEDDPDAARAGFALVLRSLPAGDELAARAGHWLEKLETRTQR